MLSFGTTRQPRILGFLGRDVISLPLPITLRFEEEAMPSTAAAAGLTPAALPRGAISSRAAGRPSPCATRVPSLLGLQHPGCSIASIGRRNACRRFRALLLEPTGDGQEDHLDSEHISPGPITLGEGLFEVGRKDPADILLQVPTVSTRHAQLKIEGKQVFVTDIGSTNGTYIDGFLLDSDVDYPLEIGSEVVFGDEHLCQFVLLDDDDLVASKDEGIIDV